VQRDQPSTHPGTATAASAALPPARSIATPAPVATWSALETIALRA
jgi:hypothetical protein